MNLDRYAVEIRPDFVLISGYWTQNNILSVAVSSTLCVSTFHEAILGHSKQAESQITLVGRRIRSLVLVCGSSKSYN